MRPLRTHCVSPSPCRIPSQLWYPPSAGICCLWQKDYAASAHQLQQAQSAGELWTVGELKRQAAQQTVHGRDGEVLTIITDYAGSEPATASIVNTVNYSVCIDSEGGDLDHDKPRRLRGHNRRQLAHDSRAGLHRRQQ